MGSDLRWPYTDFFGTGGGQNNKVNAVTIRHRKHGQHVRQKKKDIIPARIVEKAGWMLQVLAFLPLNMVL